VAGSRSHRRLSRPRRKVDFRTVDGSGHLAERDQDRSNRPGKDKHRRDSDTEAKSQGCSLVFDHDAMRAGSCELHLADAA
jgi:hypothetical protein